MWEVLKGDVCLCRFLKCRNYREMSRVVLRLGKRLRNKHSGGAISSQQQTSASMADYRFTSCLCAAIEDTESGCFSSFCKLHLILSAWLVSV